MREFDKMQWFFYPHTPSEVYDCSMNNQFHLRVDPQDWMRGLIDSLNTLRVSWQQDWVGLPAVLMACQQALGLQHQDHQEQYQGHQRVTALNAYAVQIAQRMERHEAPQPAYHNSLHTADVLVSLTVLLRIQMLQTLVIDKLLLATVLTAAVGHDFAHPGGMNQFDSEIESYSINSLKAQIDSSTLDPVDLERIEKLILRTEVKLVPSSHAAVANTDFVWSLPWCSVLLNEADILASATPEFGPTLCQSLSQEWANASVEDSLTIATPQGWLHFLKSIQFSSPAAHTLGLPAQVQRLIDFR